MNDYGCLRYVQCIHVTASCVVQIGDRAISCLDLCQFCQEPPVGGSMPTAWFEELGGFQVIMFC